MLLVTVCVVMAQRTVTGTVSDEQGEALIGASVRVKDTNVGASTDVTGKYSVKVPTGATTLVVSYTGFTSQEIVLGASNAVDITLQPNTTLEEVVVTALGITRYKNELPYSAQKVDGADLTNTRDANVVNSLSGKVAGLNIKRNNTLGGSTNVLLRGSRSLLGDNQALFVIDGVPVDNSNTNTDNQKTARGGYDYGNAANDINGDDVESITVLKGAAASALYGSRAANGVVMITTKKGAKNKGIGVSVNTGLNVGKVDQSTFLKYQTKYGGGYGAFYEDPTSFFLYRDINGDGTDDLVMPTSEDASWGGKFDPNLQVYQWDAFDPASSNFGKPRPWVAANNLPNSYFETAVGSSNSVSLDGSNDKGYFKLGYTRTEDKGILPNSKVGKNLVNFGASYKITDRLEAFSSINYTQTKGTGRYGSGYDSKNQMTSFRQWWQVNVDVDEQYEAYNRNKQNVTWNWADPSDLTPIYWDNIYWVRHENYSNDQRDRYFGYVGLNYKLTNWLSLMGRVSVDQYDELQEERIAVGSVDPSQYSRYNRSFKENNFDLMATTKQFEIAPKLKFDALVGTNVRKNTISSIRATTNGGLALPRLYSLSNSKNPLNAPTERFSQLEVDGVFGKVGFVYDGWAILDATVRRDVFSTLPKDNNAYLYPAASLGIIFSKLIPENNILTFGKARFNYAEVSNGAPVLSLFDTYSLQSSFDGNTVANIATDKNNPDLKPETTKSLEAGLEMRFLKDMVGFDLTMYKMNTVDQILLASVSRATGYNNKYINAGDVENKGVEVALFVRPVHSSNWDWRVEVNWAANRNKVLDLGGIDNLQLASLQGGVSINATLNEPYGTIRGSNYVYLDGKRVVGTNGRYQTSPTANQVIGNINPDWTGGLTNSIRYKNISFSFLIDTRQGGSLFSLDRYYGLATGLAEETAGLNDLGNELRAPLGDGGGVILDGVKADGTVNDIRVSAEQFGLFGYRRNPAAGFVYDASFIKLREANLNFNLPKSWISGKIVKGGTLGLYGRNLWIIKKNLPDADPEDGMSSGNIQGYQVGSYPTTRIIGVNLNVKF